MLPPDIVSVFTSDLDWIHLAQYVYQQWQTCVFMTLNLDGTQWMFRVKFVYKIHHFISTSFLFIWFLFFIFYLIQVTLQYKKCEADIYMNDNILDLFIVETRERRLEARQAIHLMTSGSLIIRIKGGLKLRLVEMLLLFFITRLPHI